MALTYDWQSRIQQWIDTMPELFYETLGKAPMAAHFTYDQFTVEEAGRKAFKPVPAGTAWGAKWQYGWFRTTITLPGRARGQRIVLKSGAGSESAIYVNGLAVGAWDHKHKEVPLTRHGVPGTRYEILIEAYGGHGPMITSGGPVLHGKELVPEPPATQVTTTETTYGIWHEEVYQLWLDAMTLWGIRSKLPPTSLRVQEIERGLREMTRVVDLELPPEARAATVSAGRKILQPLLACHNGSTMPTCYTFGHSHIDIAWLWPLRETESKCVRTFGNVLSLMDEYKDMKFLQSQPHLYWMVKTKHPKLYARIQQAVKQGQWVPEGAMWVEADTNITGGESLVRQFLHGKRFFREEFGLENRLLWLPDVFGYSGALPQIMKGCGVDYFSTLKIFWLPGRGQPFPYHSFWWEGIDGTQVYAHIHNDSGSPIDPASLIDRWDRRRPQEGLNVILEPYGWGDGGGGPTRTHLEYVRRQRDLEGVPKVKPSHPLDFFRDGEKNTAWMPTYVGELYFQNHRGTYTTQAKTKKGNRQSEYALREAELWGAAAQWLAGAAYPQAVLDELWQKVLLIQFHDIIPGSSIARVYEEAEADHAQVLEKSGTLAAKAAKALLRRDRDAVTVFNSLSWNREALVALPKGFAGIATDAGETLPTQVVDGTTWTRVPEIPSCGWRSFRRCKSGRTATTLKVSRTRLENEYLRVSVNALGELTSIYDKEHQRELASGPCNRMMMFKDVPHNFDAWDIDVSYRECPVPLPETATVTVKAEGPLLAILQVERKLHESVLKQEIRLAQGSRRIDFVTTIDWQERHKLLKVGFPVNVQASEALHEIQFGHLARPTHASNLLDASRFEVCQQKWTALCENSHGVALLNDCKYGLDVTGNALNLTLLKSPLAPDMRADLGVQQFTYAFYAWDGPFAGSEVIREAYALNVPVKVVPGRAADTSLFGLDQPNIILETVKAAEDGSGDLVLRLYEAKNMHSRCILTTTLPVKRAQLTNMLEAAGTGLQCRDGKITLDFRPFEIKTLRFKKP